MQPHECLILAFHNFPIHHFLNIATYHNHVTWLSVCLSVFDCSAVKTEYCEWETFNATCPDPDQVIVIRSARYGRMKIGDCITSNYGHIGCATDVTSDFERACSGRRRCQIGVITLHDRRSCPKDFKSYLEAHYDCVRGLNVYHICLPHFSSLLFPLTIWFN